MSRDAMRPTLCIMTISFLYKRIERVYYSFMALGTSETVSTIALAMVPPGNVTRTIADIRRAFWTELGAPSARAYFDYPVVAWLGQPLTGAYLAGIASRSRLPFELIGLERIGDDVFLRFPDSLSSALEELVSRVPLATESSDRRPGPFEAGKGCYCATLDSASGAQLPIVDELAVSAIRAKTYVLAQIELRWAADSGLSSSWATLSSARTTVKVR